tara:strand:+ start:262 stop:426 length:165 start_codon:yes stop_codon:yes gene_type:complete
VRILREGCQCNPNGFAQELRKVQPLEERIKKMTVYPLLGASSRGKNASKNSIES